MSPTTLGEQFEVTAGSTTEDLLRRFQVHRHYIPHLLARLADARAEHGDLVWVPHEGTWRRWIHGELVKAEGFLRPNVLVP